MGVLSWSQCSSCDEENAKWRLALKLWLEGTDEVLPRVVLYTDPSLRLQLTPLPSLEKIRGAS